LKVSASLTYIGFAVDFITLSVILFLIGKSTVESKVSPELQAALELSSEMLDDEDWPE